jgi:hypothetical protein
MAALRLFPVLQTDPTYSSSFFNDNLQIFSPKIPPLRCFLEIHVGGECETIRVGTLRGLLVE